MPLAELRRREGGCLCGRVRYVLRGEPRLAEHCHCSLCRKWHGAAFSSNGEVSAADFDWLKGEGELAGWRSSAARERVFCRHCGGKLLIRRLDQPGELALCLATLDDGSGIQPARHVFHGDRVPWHEPSDSLPCFDLYPGWEVTLRPTLPEDFEFVMALERHPDNSSFVGQWTREQHAHAVEAPDREHWVVARRRDGVPVGFMIVYDLRAAGHGIHLKRIVVDQKGRGLGREALGQLAARSFGVLGASHLWLSVYRENERAQRTYRALGFSADEPTPELRASVGGFSERSLIMTLRSPERG
jgi:ribosomal protein S18 acetylase RimI-like enzyme